MVVRESLGLLLVSLGWLVLTVRRVGWGAVLRVITWTGARTVEWLAEVVPRRHRRRVAVYARLAWTTYRCRRHGLR